jgi:hypothetical protein
MQGKPLKESFAAAKQGGEFGQVAYTIPAGHFSFVVRQPSPHSSNADASPVNASE